MPELKPSETGATVFVQCQGPNCRGWCVRSGDGFTLPFCLEHLRPLSRQVFDNLVARAKGDIYETTDVELAQCAVREAFLELVLAELPTKEPA